MRRALVPALAACALAGCAAGTHEADRVKPVARRTVVPPVVVSTSFGACTPARDADRGLVERLAKAPPAGAELAALTVDYPVTESIFPPDMAAPTFLWHDASAQADRWLVEIAFAGDANRLHALVPGGAPPEGEIDPRCLKETNEIHRPTEYQASAEAWRPCADLWAAIKERSVDRPATIAFYGFRDAEPDHVVSRGAVTIRTSADPVGAPIFYRDVPLMPSATEEGVIKPLDQSAQPLIAWRLRDVGQDASRVLLTDMPSCANCHSFSADGKTLGMDLDGPAGDKGAYVLTSVAPQTVVRDENVITWNAFSGKPQGLNTLGFLARVSPDGRHVVATVNEALFVRNFTDYRFTQVFYPTRGILAVYSRETGEIHALPGADDPAFVHCDPVWTPDGQTIVFARAAARDPYDRTRPLASFAGDPNETPIRYDLYRIPFNEGRGGRAEPITGASGNGMSNSFPKVSPDGRWIVWVQARNGQLMRPDGKLWIVPLQGGTPRLMRCNTPLMNSWHSFSPSGRWMVFSSKQNTPYTQMFLTHIDERGNDSPAILVDNSTAANRAVNIPEFVNTAYENFQSIAVPVVAYQENFTRGNELAREGRYREALAEYEKALGPVRREWRINDARIHDSLCKVFFKLGDIERALHHAQASLQMNPVNAEMHGTVGLVLFQKGVLGEARRHLDIALQLAPGDGRTWFNRASVRLNQGDDAGAAQDFGRAIALDPAFADAYSGRGVARMGSGDLRGARADLDRALELNPRDHTSLVFRARLRERRGDSPGALRDLERALGLLPPGSPEHASVAAEVQSRR